MIQFASMEPIHQCRASISSVILIRQYEVKAKSMHARTGTGQVFRNRRTGVLDLHGRNL